MLGLDLVLGGQVFRTMAVERGMSLADFGAYASDHPDVDVELDRRLAVRAREGDVVIESRLAGWIVHNEGLDALSVGLRCDDLVRAERVAGRERIPVDQAMADNADREKVEADRYLALYGIDLADMSIYDLVVDTGLHPPDEVTRQIVTAASNPPPKRGA